MLTRHTKHVPDKNGGTKQIVNNRWFVCQGARRVESLLTDFR